MTTMDWVLYFGVPVCALILYFLYQEYKNKQNNLRKLRSAFGKKADKKYIYEEFENISHGFFLQNDDDLNVIDDITWNDLNMDAVYKQMDCTASSLGQEALYSMLRTPIVEDEELGRRKKLIDYFTEHENERTKLSMIYSGFGYSRKMSVADYIESIGECKTVSAVPHFIMLILFAAALVYCLTINIAIGMWAVIGMMVINVVSYFRFKAEIEVYFVCIKQVFSMCACAQSILKSNIAGIKEYSEELSGLVHEFDGARRFSWIMATGRGGVLEFILDYIRMITHLDIIKFCFVVNGLNRKKDAVWMLYNRLGYFDALIAAASYKKSLQYTCEPEFTDGSARVLDVQELYHPLIDEPVANSIRTDKSVLITGSNASGKSTFLRSVGICALLSQTLGYATAKSYRAEKFRIYSSMALKDNLLGSESYYMVEIKSLKRIMDAAAVKSDYPVLCFIDEVLRGTNTVERIAASSQILKGLSCADTICIAATHDIELTGILERYYSNYHFTEEITDNDVEFSYKLMKGRATSRNAIKLLGLLGYEKSIISQATESAKHFEETGNWSL